MRMWSRLIMLLLAGSGNAVEPAPAMENAFFAFDNGVGRGTWTPEQQAETLARLGYDGIGYTGVEDLDTRLEAFEKHNVRIFNLYVPCYVDRAPAYGEGLKEAIARLKGSEVSLWLTVQGQSESDDPAVRVVGEIADLAAASGLTVALYPHAGFYVADIDDAMRVVNKLDRKNVGVTFNLCHELKAGNEARFGPLLETTAPYLRFVSINGADHSGGWDKVIRRLGEGEFDVVALLGKLRAIGYSGPIGLQCYQVPGNTEENLAHNIETWRQMSVSLKQR